MKRHFLLIFISVTLLTLGCEDFFEEDLSSKSVSLIAPSDGVVSDISTQTFWWEEMDGALEYELQVVSVRFDSISQLIVDTTVTETQFQQTLYPGKFQWRVRALNGSSESPYTTFSLTVDSTSTLTNETIILSLPSSSGYSNNLTQEFSWQSLSFATLYRLQISDDSFLSGANVLDTTLSSESVSVTFGDDIRYYWRVRGETETSVSSYSSIWNITIDTTAPEAVSLWLPENNATFQSQSFDFAWQDVSDDGAPLIDSLYVYTDSLITLYTSYMGNQGSVTDSLEVGTYYWRVRTFDEAGNIGSYSDTRRFTIY